MQQEIDSEIIQRAQRGDVKAFAEVYRTFADMVFTIALRFTNCREEAEEIAQEVFITLFRKLGQFGFQSTLKTWVYRITVNTALTARRKKVREVAQRVLGEKGMELASTEPTPDARAEAEEVLSTILELLPPDQRICIVLRHFGDLAYQEISDVLEVNLNTVRSRLKRARETILEWKQRTDA